MYTLNIFETKYFEKGLSKSLNKVNFIISFKYIPFNGQKYQKQTGPETNDESRFTLQNKFKITPFFSLVMYCLTKYDDFLVISIIFKFMQGNSWHHRLFHFQLSFWISKMRKGREKLQKIEYLQTKKNFFDVIKNIFYSFWRATLWWKNKSFIKNSEKKLLNTLERFKISTFWIP